MKKTHANSFNYKIKLSDNYNDKNNETDKNSKLNKNMYLVKEINTANIAIEVNNKFFNTNTTFSLYNNLNSQLKFSKKLETKGLLKMGIKISKPNLTERDTTTNRLLFITKNKNDNIAYSLRKDYLKGEEKFQEIKSKPYKSHHTSSLLSPLGKVNMLSSSKIKHNRKLSELPSTSKISEINSLIPLNSNTGKLTY